MTILLAGPLQTITLEERELTLARDSGSSLSRRFEADGKPVTLRFTDPASGDEVEAKVPVNAMRVLAEAMVQMGAGHAVTLVPLQAELSTQQAAELVGVSRPYFVKLLETGRLPFRRVGDQRRVRYQDLLHYLEEERRRGEDAVSQMTADAQALGLYE
jgi:excisionase family DNA binding protein